jgi:hypothetical protein
MYKYLRYWMWCTSTLMKWGDSHVKQDLLNHVRNQEKYLVAESARLQLPVPVSHIQRAAGGQTHRLAQILKTGKHKLELVIDRATTGVSLVEPKVVSYNSMGQSVIPDWLRFIIGGVVILLAVMALH